MYSFAEVSLNKDLNHVRPVLNLEGNLNILGARHPCLEGNQIVENDCIMNDEEYGKFHIITGPNMSK